MNRDIYQALAKWQQDSQRKPLIIRGARQVGKTYALQHFGSQAYQDVAYFNFDHDENLASLFVQTKDPLRIIEQLALIAGVKIVPHDTLIIFDEIQECPDALNSLKYFYELAPEYHVACAGSLLGISLSHTSFPVGKVDFLHLHPLSFREFLLAGGHDNLVQALAQATLSTPVADSLTSQLEEQLKVYFIIGGMPEAVAAWHSAHDLPRVYQILDNILQSYKMDFSKHTTHIEANKISLIWDSLPSQLARENKKFLYKAAKAGARAREYEAALNWLRDADLITKLQNITKPALPLTAYQDLSAFKIYLNDVGLLARMSGLDSSIILKGDQLFSEFKGSLTENYIINVLYRSTIDAVAYFAMDATHEIDAVIQAKNQIIPIEIKSGTNKRHASLSAYVVKYQPHNSLRFSTRPLKKVVQITNIPLYLAEFFMNFL